MIFTGIDRGGDSSCFESTARDRFYAKLKKDESTGCWNWIGYLCEWGYGALRIGRKIHKAHRVSYELHIGPIPEGLLVCHECDNPKCVNPAHLFLGTNKENADDRDIKGRNINPCGEQHGGSKLNDKKVLEIRTKYAPRKYSCSKLGAEYGVNKATIQQIVHGQTWAHVGGPIVPILKTARWHKSAREDQQLATVTWESVKEVA